MEDAISERFREGIDLFNEHSFYKCHDVLEDVWFDVTGSSRRFYQGLIHLAVGFYHILERENPKGAISQLSKGVEKLSDYIPQYQGVEIEILLKKIEKCIGEVKSLGKEKINEFDESLIPTILFKSEKFIEP